jgi:hypothetical protein
MTHSTCPERGERVQAAVVMLFAMRRIILGLIALAALLVGCLLLVEVVWLAGERV